MHYLQVYESNSVGVSVMLGLAGSWCIVLCVLATVWMAAYIYKREQQGLREESGEKSI